MDDFSMMLTYTIRLMMLKARLAIANPLNLGLKLDSFDGFIRIQEVRELSRYRSNRARAGQSVRRRARWGLCWRRGGEAPQRP